MNKFELLEKNFGFSKEFVRVAGMSVGVKVITSVAGTEDAVDVITAGAGGF